jgi:5-methylcytosine-specific restriction endonuclease McrA
MKRKQLVRERFREAVFKRDNFTCRKCGTKASDTVRHDAHHIIDRNEMPNGGYVKENGITLCEPVCHMLAEKFHISGGTEWEPGMHPKDLFNLIGSSRDIAVLASERLK